MSSVRENIIWRPLVCLRFEGTHMHTRSMRRNEESQQQQLPQQSLWLVWGRERKQAWMHMEHKKPSGHLILVLLSNLNGMMCAHATFYSHNKFIIERKLWIQVANWMWQTSTGPFTSAFDDNLTHRKKETNSMKSVPTINKLKHDTKNGIVKNFFFFVFEHKQWTKQNHLVFIDRCAFYQKVQLHELNGKSHNEICTNQCCWLRIRFWNIF